MKIYQMADVANKFNVSSRTVKRWCEKGYIQFDKDDKSRAIFTQKHIDDFENKGREKGYQVMK